MMLVEYPQVRLKVRKVAFTVNKEVGLLEDLYHEGIWCLIRSELNFPNCTLSWYLTRCRFHLLDYLGQGRSLDALKRRHLASPLPDESFEDGCKYEIPAV